MQVIMAWSADLDAGRESSKVNWRPSCPLRTAFQLDYIVCYRPGSSNSETWKWGYLRICLCAVRLTVCGLKAWHNLILTLASLHTRQPSFLCKCLYYHASRHQHFNAWATSALYYLSSVRYPESTGNEHQLMNREYWNWAWIVHAIDNVPHWWGWLCYKCVL